MIVPDLDVAKTYLGSGSIENLANQILTGSPWFCDQIGVPFRPWASEILLQSGFPRTAGLYLVGSAVNGFSLSPEKAGAPFRLLSIDGRASDGRASDLDFCLVDSQLYTRAWNSMLQEDRSLRMGHQKDPTRLRVYWGRIDQWEVLHKDRAVLRNLLDSIQRTPAYRGYRTSIRVYRRRQDLLSYTTWSLSQLRKAIRR